MNIQEKIKQMDVVNYYLHFTTPTTQKKEKLKKLQKESKVLMKDYIWQEEPFHLQMKPDESIFGKTKFRDNIDDEWFIVYILIELTKNNQDIAFQIQDIDGEFLLIESEQFIPDWINPENAKNRVFIFKGKVHIIPISPSDPSEIDLFTDDDLKSSLEISKSIELLNSDLKTEASKQIQITILKRIPETNLHHVRCFIPKKIAKILQFDPQYISKAVNSFFYRTPDTMKCLSKLKLFNDDFIMYRISFTRCLYAQLKNPPFNLPKSLNKMPPNYHKDYLAYFLGYRLTCGFEMYFNENTTSLKELESKLMNYTFNEPTSIPSDDSEEWMNVYNEATEKISNKEALGDDMIKKMKQFFSSESSIDGVEFDKDTILNNIFNMNEDEMTSEMKEYMNALDDELKEYGILDDEENDVELNLLQNMLEGYKSQSGEAGPISSLFQQMGLDLPDDLDDSQF
eukprot:gene6424-10432_t